MPHGIVLALLLSAAPDWQIPKVVGVAAVTEPVESMGVPLQLRAYRTAVPQAELIAHFLLRFEALGLYVPPLDRQRQLTGNLTLTALDVRTLVAYTFIFQPLKDGGTTVILGEGFLAQRRAPGVGLPLVPGARDVVRSQSEGTDAVTYRSTASPVEVLDFYRATLKGWAEREPGVFTRPGQEVRVKVRGSNVLVLQLPAPR